MRLRRGVPMLAAIATTAAIAAPAAQARFDESMPNHPPSVPYVVHHSGGGSTDWALIGLGAAGGIALLGAGAARSQHVLRRTTHVRATTSS
jgi:hypothetical protein